MCYYQVITTAPCREKCVLMYFYRCVEGFKLYAFYDISRRLILSYIFLGCHMKAEIKRKALTLLLREKKKLGLGLSQRQRRGRKIVEVKRKKKT